MKQKMLVRSLIVAGVISGATLGGYIAQSTNTLPNASAAGTRSLSALAPRLPPTTSKRSGPERPANRSDGGPTLAIASRKGLPTHWTLPA